jgi:hypothetical protein
MLLHFGKGLLCDIDQASARGGQDPCEHPRALIHAQSFGKHIGVDNLGITIRPLGGLLSAYLLTGGNQLLMLAHHLGIGLLPAFRGHAFLPEAAAAMQCNISCGAIQVSRARRLQYNPLCTLPHI